MVKVSPVESVEFDLDPEMLAELEKEFGDKYCPTCERIKPLQQFYKYRSGRRAGTPVCE